MEEKINIAKILKDKPKVLNLYSPVYGKVKFEAVHKDKIYFYHDMNEHSVKSNGKSFDDGEVVIFPSQEMRDWSKFVWKRGDVLVNKDGDVYIIFERFADDTYCSFVGKYYLWKENNDTEHFYKNERLLTSDFQKAGKDADQTYISNIEERLGGKLNRETLEIEKTQPEFKDGDVVAFGESVAIYKKLENDELYFYACIETAWGLILSDSVNTSLEYRLATDSEKQQLFDALAKKGKRWNAKKKKVVDLPKKSEFKPMDWCLMRGGKEHFVSDWTLCQFSHKMECGKYRAVGGCAYDECISYNDQTKHLLGTTDEWKGGEG